MQKSYGGGSRGRALGSLLVVFPGFHRAIQVTQLSGLQVNASLSSVVITNPLGLYYLLFVPVLVWIFSHFHSAVCNHSYANLLPQFLPVKCSLAEGTGLWKWKGIHGALAGITVR